MSTPLFYCPQCGESCNDITKSEPVEYDVRCPWGHKWAVTIDTDHPTTGGRIIGFQCDGAKAQDFFGKKGGAG